MEAQYRILFSGKLMPGQELSHVAARLAKKFRMQENTARELILKGGGRVLKQNLNASAAERYRAALTAAGLVITIEPQETDSSSDVESLLRPYSMTPSMISNVSTAPSPSLEKSRPPARRKESRTSKEPGDGWSRCPKCGEPEVSDLTGVCQACGVVVERYLANRGMAEETEKTVENPYAPPRADLTPPPIDDSEDALQPARSVAAGRGWGWILSGWELFKDRPGAWIGAVLLFYLIIIALSLVPVLGGLATTILGPMFTAGFMMGAHAQFKGEGFSVNHLFAGISRKPGPLALVGVFYLLFALGIGLVVGGLIAVMLGASGAFMGASGGNAGLGALDVSAVALPTLIALLLGVPLVMAIFFAPALVALNDVPVMRAFKLSFLGCLRNILPFLVFGLIAMLMLFLAMLPFMLGLLVAMPILTIAVYFSYRDIFYR
ncbi:BPSS1780 family membrane protein [Imhoffiella purpurea]|uniref:Transmembrane protein n=1 Tax=Imhoffiella purpurea TaxID=1249627 RepID=W9VC67_9GAMM|nr:BPSS1780 family membrane protein [Imhoffiella purpurea]EXJ17183.1 hypothetical protein D779_0010 [Imhoffiella purpurea]